MPQPVRMNRVIEPVIQYLGRSTVDLPPAPVVHRDHSLRFTDFTDNIRASLRLSLYGHLFKLNHVERIENRNCPDGTNPLHQRGQILPKLLLLIRTPPRIVHADHHGDHLRFELCHPPVKVAQYPVGRIAADAGLDDHVTRPPVFSPNPLFKMLRIAALAQRMHDCMGNAVSGKEPIERRTPFSHHRLNLCQVLFRIAGHHPGIELIHGLQMKANRQDVRRLTLSPVSISDIQQVTRGQNRHSRIGAIPGVLIILEADSVLARASIEQVIIGSDPGDPIASGGRALTRRLHIAK